VGLYDTYLAVRHRLHDGDPPEHVAIVITERDLLANGAFDTLSAALGWAFEYGAERVTVSVSVLDAAVVSTLVRELRRIDAPRRVVVRGPEDEVLDGGVVDGGVVAGSVVDGGIVDDGVVDDSASESETAPGDESGTDSERRRRNRRSDAEGQRDGRLDDAPIRSRSGSAGKPSSRPQSGSSSSTWTPATSIRNRSTPPTSRTGWCSPKSPIRDQNRRRAALGLRHLAVGVRRTLLYRCELAGLQKAGLPPGGA